MTISLDWNIQAFIFVALDSDNAYKNVKGIYDVYGINGSYPALHIFSTDWGDTSTAWTSLGTITFPQATSGYIIVRRLV